MASEYYYYSSKAGKSPSQNIQILAPSTNIDDFVTELEDQVLVLTGAPNPDATFDSSDKWSQWLSTKVDPSGAGILSLTADESASKNIQSFKYKGFAPWNITFSSAADALIFTFGQQVPPGGSLVPVPGIDADGTYLYCGLDIAATPKISTTIKAIFSFAGLDVEKINSFPQKANDLEATLDTSKVDTVKEKRNAMWLSPSSGSQTTVRLQMQVPLIEYLQSSFDAVLSGFKIDVSGDVICKRTVTKIPGPDGPIAAVQGSVAFSVNASITRNTTTIEVNSVIVYYQGSFEVILTFGAGSPDLVTMLLWLADHSGGDLSWIEDVLGKDGLFDQTKILIRQVRIGIDTSQGSDKPTFQSFGLDIEVSAYFGSSDPSKPVAFLLSYAWDKESGGLGQIVGQLWKYDSSPALKLSPDYEDWRFFKPSSGPNTATSIDLTQVIVGHTIKDIPENIPTQLSRAYILLSTKRFVIGATIDTINAPNASTVPQPRLKQVDLDGSFDFGNVTGFTVNLGFDAELLPTSISKHKEPATFQGRFAYDSKGPTWTLSAKLNGLYASTLVEFFDPDSADHVMPLIDSIAIKELDVQYEYVAAKNSAAANTSSALVRAGEVKSTASSFTITGDLVIALLELSLTFTYKENKPNFHAVIKPTDQNATLSEILASILGEESLELPDFLSDTVFKGNKQFTLDIGTTSSDFFQFAAVLQLDPVTFTFLQYHGTTWEKTRPSKRLAKVGFKGFPDASVTIPLVGTLSQPFEELYYMWVQDPMKPKTPNENLGITRAELRFINTTLAATKNEIIIKDSFKAPTETDILISAGSHLVVVIVDSLEKQSCLLDYAFMKPKPVATEKSAQLAIAAPKDKDSNKTLEAAPEGEDAATSAQAPFKKQSGPLSISNIGLKYTKKELHIKFDAMFELGPLAFSLIGFSIIVGIKGVYEISSVRPSIDGLAVAFEKPPITIAGLIVHGSDPGLDYYAGGMIVGFVPYQLMAAGFYGKATPEGQDPSKTFTSVFIFAKLDGPLVVLEFGEISGVTGGFGYNSNVRIPTAAQITEFPFVAKSGTASNAIETLQKLTKPGGWFSPLDKTYWAAAGMKIDAFQMISLDAVVLVQFGSSIKLGVFAVAIADIPTTKAEFKFAHVELGIAVTVDFEYGVLKAEAQLAPRSFILHPDCHLTGGFALYYWFDAPHADAAKVGDFVFTLGGYHPAFIIPDGYPNPPRLGISWSYGSAISITGEAYFAITPHACMGGGRLHAAFSKGPINAWFDAFANFLINYKPFHFVANAGISVGVRYNLDLWFIHTHVSVEIGATLDLWGPPVAGRVRVNFYIVTFYINFGDAPTSVASVNLLQFYKLVLQASSQSTADQQARKPMALTQGAEEDEEEDDSYVRPENEGHVFLAQSGLTNTSDQAEKKPKDPWWVRGGSFAFVIACKMAVATVELGDEKHTLDYTDKQIFSQPMHLLNPMTSKMTVTIQQKEAPLPETDWQMDRHIKSVPTALWSQYNSSTDPLKSGNYINGLLQPPSSGLPLMMGVLLRAPKPQLSPDILPIFNIVDASVKIISAEQGFPTFKEENTDWEPIAPLKFPGQWAAVKERWEEPQLEASGQQEFADSWAKLMGWGDALTAFPPKVPEKIEEDFTTLYVAAPLLSRLVATAA